jgi:hypothetical protein
MRKPREETGGALTQAPEPLDLAAKRRDLDTGSSQLDKRMANKWSTLGLSHDFWWLGEVGRGVSAGRSLFHAANAESFSVWIRGQIGWQKSWHKFRGYISRCQKGRRCKIGGTSESKTTGLYR